MAGLQTTDFRQQTHAVRPCNLAFDIFKRDAARHVSTDERSTSLLNAKLLNF